MNRWGWWWWWWWWWWCWWRWCWWLDVWSGSSSIYAGSTPATAEAPAARASVAAAAVGRRHDDADRQRRRRWHRLPPGAGVDAAADHRPTGGGACRAPATLRLAGRLRRLREAVQLQHQASPRAAGRHRAAGDGNEAENCQTQEMKLSPRRLSDCLRDTSSFIHVFLFASFASIMCTLRAGY